jgi:hypothetical protein
MTFLKLPVRFTLLSGLLSLPLLGTAQTDPNALTTAVPILTISPDSRSAALGEAGVAISPDANAGYHNAGKLGFINTKYSASPSYSPWLRSVTDDMGLAYLSGAAKINDRAAISASLMYFDLGEISFRDVNNISLGDFDPKEYAVSIAYGQKLSEYFGVGIAARYIRSNLTGNSSGNDARPGNAAAVDLGAYYNRDLTIGAGDYNLGLGATISNIGNKITYTNANQADFLPTRLRLGFAFTRELDAYNKITLTVEGAKLLTPSPFYEEGPIGTDTASVNGRARRERAENNRRRDKGIVSAALGSFSDAPGGFREELREVNLSTGVEYTYNDLLMARVGYFYESPVKGDRQYLSFGLGVRYQVFGVDGAYLVPNSRANPLAQTIRISLHFNFNELDQAFGDGSSDTPAN